jgi:hypothetical protein
LINFKKIMRNYPTPSIFIKVKHGKWLTNFNHKVINHRNPLSIKRIITTNLLDLRTIARILIRLNLILAQTLARNLIIRVTNILIILSRVVY